MSGRSRNPSLDVLGSSCVTAQRMETIHAVLGCQADEFSLDFGGRHLAVRMTLNQTLYLGLELYQMALQRVGLDNAERVVDDQLRWVGRHRFASVCPKLHAQRDSVDYHAQPESARQLEEWLPSLGLPSSPGGSSVRCLRQKRGSG